MKTVKEIVEETIAYYSEDVNRRNYDEKKGQCMYYTNGKTCAVGRCLENPELFSKEADGAEIFIRKWGANIFKEEYRGHDYSFWKELQDLHDSDHYWSETGINEIGKEYAEDIINTYSNEAT